MPRANDTLCTLALISVFLLPLGVEALELTVPINVPRVDAMTAAIPVDGAADVAVDLALAYDEAGKLICSGNCTVDGVAVLVKGKIKNKKGIVTFVVALKGIDQKISVKLKGVIADANTVADAKYAGPKGKAKALGLAVNVTKATVENTLDIAPTVGADGSVTGSVTVTSGLRGTQTNVPFVGKIKNERLSFKITAGREKFAYKGARNGLDFTGVLKAKMPPAKAVLDNFVVEDLTIDEIRIAIQNLAAGQWYEIPNSRLDQSPAVWDETFLGDLGSIMGAASGGTYDSKRDRLIVWGGGAAGYHGNEIYAFNMNNFRWERLNDPSAFAPGEEGNPNDDFRHPDGSPIARHTYDYLAYLPDPVDRFFVGGGSALWGSGQVVDRAAYLFDFDTLMWEQRSETTSATLGAVCAVGPNGHVWQAGAQNVNNFFSEYDPGTDTWTQHSQFSGFFEIFNTAEIDPVRNKFVTVGNLDGTTVWDLDNPADPAVTLATTGDTAIENGDRPGLVYHPPSDKLIAWDGTQSVYILDLDLATWTATPASGAVDPGLANDRGTGGRFAWVASLAVFVQVSETNRSVYVYRLP